MGLVHYYKLAELDFGSFGVQPTSAPSSCYAKGFQI